MIRLILIDDHELFCAGLRTLLEQTGEMTVVATAGEAREAKAVAAGNACDVIVADLTLPGAGGSSLLRDLKGALPRRPVMVLSMHEHRDVVADALDSGAEGFALKSQSPAEIFEAIRVVAGGGRYLAPQLRGIGEAEEGKAPAGLFKALSKREREIFDLLVRGHSNSEIARLLFISVKTVETHRTRVMKKLAVHSMGELIRLAARHGHLAA